MLVKTVYSHLNTLRFTKNSSTTLQKHYKAGFQFSTDDIITAQKLVKKLKVSARVRNLALKIITSSFYAPNIKFKINPEENSPHCTLCGYHTATQSHIFNHCPFAQITKIIFGCAYLIDYGTSLKMDSVYTYIAAIPPNKYSKKDQVNLDSLIHLANYIIYIAGIKKFLINGLNDFLNLIHKTCLIAAAL